MHMKRSLEIFLKIYYSTGAIIWCCTVLTQLNSKVTHVTFLFGVVVIHLKSFRNSDGNDTHDDNGDDYYMKSTRICIMWWWYTETRFIPHLCWNVLNILHNKCFRLFVFMKSSGMFHQLFGNLLYFINRTCIIKKVLLGLVRMELI